MVKTLSATFAKYTDSPRQELDIKLWLVFLISLVLTLTIYGFLLPARSSYLGILLYERGFTQILAIGLAGIVLALTCLKFLKIQREFRALKRNWLPEKISLHNPYSKVVANLQENLANEKNLLPVRCSRVLAAYMYSGTRKAAMEFALDDSSFYVSASESSYAFPRILVWAIPLLGFIGTVMGISSAVTGFSKFLDNAVEIDQIKEGIGTVTSGLAVAFDTTLLALFLSILVMIPLVLVERLESRLLLGIDVYIQERLLTRLKEGSEELNQDAIASAVEQALKNNFPQPEELIKPAQEYAQQAATLIARTFVQEITKVQEMTSKLIGETTQMNELIMRDRQTYINLIEQLRTTQENTTFQMINELRATNQQFILELQSNNSNVAHGLTYQAEQIRQQLEEAAMSLESRVVSLEKSSIQISKIVQLQQSLDKTVNNLEKTAQLEKVLVGVRENLSLLEPLLQQLSKPRRITLVEKDH